MRSFSRSLTRTLPVVAALAIGCAPGPKPEVAPQSTVTSEDLRNPNEPIEVVLQRKVPGLIVTRTGDGGIALQLRGSSSYNNAPTPPLYVLDGIQFQPGPGGALTGVNPDEIESIKVLRAAEAGLYGIQGANGVIVITTKRGKRN